MSVLFKKEYVNIFTACLYFYSFNNEILMIGSLILVHHLILCTKSLVNYNAIKKMNTIILLIVVNCGPVV